MKLTQLISLSFALTIPFALLSCGEKDSEPSQDDPSADAPTSGEATTHVEIGEEISSVLDEMMRGLAEVKDEATANEFSEKMDGYASVLEDLLMKAKELPAPTKEEKAAIQKIKDASNEAGKKVFDGLGELGEDTQGTEAIRKAVSEFIKNEKMSETMKSFEQLYDLDQ